METRQGPRGLRRYDSGSIESAPSRLVWRMLSVNSGSRREQHSRVKEAEPVTVRTELAETNL